MKRGRREETRKITVNLPAALIDAVMKYNDKSQTDVFCEALRLYRASRAYKALRELKGTGGLMMSYEDIKELRD
jgi:hypothetical protein